ncbi:MlaD family protein [Patulibacter defluvii]|uniref:MlaD family protein n=1 Tax=Patulibacter defluvii TaxID=3095358 RepID=UPI002A763CCA|nr:MlaD family protein [Patulibacter sp. DM4]
MSAARRRRPAGGDRRPPYLAIGLVGTVVLLLVAALIVSGQGLPGSGGRQLRGVFNGTMGLRVGSPVRVAGVQIGKVSGVDAGPGATARVTMELRDDAPPLRAGTRLRIRPRVFLEGGYIVEVEPGPPGAAPLADGATIPRRDTALAVSLPSVVGLLDRDARAQITTSVSELDVALGRSGSAAPLLRALPPTLRDATRLAVAARGTRPGELRELLRNADRATAALAAHRDGLGQTLAGVRRVTGIVADEDAATRAVLREIPRIAERAPGALRAIRRALPVVDGLVADLRPALEVAPPALTAADRTLRQADRLSRPAELPALARAARPLLDELPDVLDLGSATLAQATPLVRCLRDKILVGFDQRVPDGELSTGTTVLQELLSLAVNLASAGQGFDANGANVRLAAVLGPKIFAADATTGLGPLTATTGDEIDGARPAWYGTNGLPPFRPDLACVDQPLPPLRSATVRAGTTRPAPAGGAAGTPAGPADRATLRRAVRALDALLGEPEGRR